MSALLGFALMIAIPLALAAIAMRYFTGCWPWRLGRRSSELDAVRARWAAGCAAMASGDWQKIAAWQESERQVILRAVDELTHQEKEFYEND